MSHEQIPKGNIILEYLDNWHGTSHSERKILIDQMYKTVIDKIVPDYIKIILQWCDEEIKIIQDPEKVKKI